MNDSVSALRKDLELIPVQHEGKQLVLIRDHLGLVPEGKAVELPLYRFMALLDGSRDMRDLQTALMRMQGGVFVGSDEVKRVLAHLDQSYLLDSDGFRKARDQIVEAFMSSPVRPCSHCGRAYPNDPAQLRAKLEEILAGGKAVPQPDGKVLALVSPHIDLSVGFHGYGAAYHGIGRETPSRVIVLGVGHQVFQGLFSVTEKDFSTPLGTVKGDKAAAKKLKSSGKDVIAPDDFAHRAEHSIEFQVIFLRHILDRTPFQIVPILCGSLHASLPEYRRSVYHDKAGRFLEGLREIVGDPGHETMVVAGVDLSHIGPKFGHDMPARHLENRSGAHDKALLHHLLSMNAEGFWEESAKVNDQYNVCGFAALACLLEVLPPSEGRLLHYEIWHEDATQSAVSFAAVVFAEKKQQ
jgi:AmmeMemoRadiSam system protein B